MGVTFITDEMTKKCSGDTTLEWTDCMNYKAIQFQGSGATLTFPTPDGSVVGCDITVYNTDSSSGAIAATFAGGATGVDLPAYTSVIMRVTPYKESGTYNWSLIGSITPA